eukprot:3864623-Pleurochrysis_carterae.AAC.6
MPVRIIINQVMLATTMDELWNPGNFGEQLIKWRESCCNRHQGVRSSSCLRLPAPVRDAPWIPCRDDEVSVWEDDRVVRVLVPQVAEQAADVDGGDEAVLRVEDAHWPLERGYHRVTAWEPLGRGEETDVARSLQARVGELRVKLEEDVHRCGRRRVEIKVLVAVVFAIGNQQSPSSRIMSLARQRSGPCTAPVW